MDRLCWRLALRISTSCIRFAINRSAAAPRAKVGALPPRSTPLVSANVLVSDLDRSYHVCRKTARKKVDRGGYRWAGDFEIRRIAAKKPAPRMFWSDPKAAFLWAPRPSANYLVMQARWGKMTA